MFTEDEMLRDLQQADASGDTELANRIAARIKAQRSTIYPDETARTMRPQEPKGGLTWDNYVNAVKGIAGDIGNLGAGVRKSATDAALGVRQLAASAGLGDKDALAAEAAAKEQADAPLMKTIAGNLGKGAGDIGMAFVPGSVAAKATMLPQATNRIIQFLANTAGQAGVGAGIGTLTPGAQYDPVKQAEQGAEFGVGGKVLGDVGSFLARPFGRFIDKASPTVKENLDTLRVAGMPSELAVDQTAEPFVRNATDAVELIPGIKSAVTNSRNQNLEWLTRKATQGTGAETSFITPSWKESQANRLIEEARLFRQGPDVPLPNMSNDLQDALDSIIKSAQFSGRSAGPNALTNAIRVSSPSPSGQQPAIMDTIARASGQGTGNAPSLTADEALTLRSIASDLAHGLSDSPKAAIERGAYKTLQNTLDDAIKATHPDGGVLFDQWRKQWGNQQDVLAAAKDTVGGRLIPKRIADEMVPTGIKELTPDQKTFQAAAENIHMPSGWQNRGMLLSLLLGGVPITAGVASDIKNGQFGPGTGAGIAASATAIHGLTRKPPTKEELDFIRQLLASGAVGIGN
jgi:hypothetical protein